MSSLGPRLFFESKQPVARILIVDDEPSILFTFQMVLEAEGYEVMTADSAANAMQKRASESFDIVITDVRMETPTAGFELLRSVRQTSPAIPVALLTAYPLPTSDWKRAGADAFFNKGAEVKPMLEWIRERLEAAHVNGGVANMSQPAEPAKKQAI